MEHIKIVSGSTESVAVENEIGARITKLASSGRMLKLLYKDVITQVDAVQRGCRISGNGRCIGWRGSNNEYSWLNYQEFINRAKHFGAGLINLKVNLGQTCFVGIYAQNCVEWLIAQHGCFNFSSPIVPLYDTLGPNAITYMINHAEIQIIICDNEKKVKTLLDKKEYMPTLEYVICVDKLSEEVNTLGKQKGVEIHLFKNVEDTGKLNPHPCKFPKSNDVAEICYTSGTTGSPKGAVITHQNFIAAVSGTILQMGSTAPDFSDTMISYLPLAHILEQICEVMVLINGGSIGFFKGDIKLLMDDMKVLQPSFFPAVPRLLNRLFDQAQAQLNRKTGRNIENNSFIKEKTTKVNTPATWNPNLYKSFSNKLGGKVKLILTAAAPISDAVLYFYREALDCNVVELYGQTETAGPCTANVVSQISIGNVGPPIACCMIKLEDVPDLGYFKNNNTGELCVKGYNVMKCYYKDPERTMEAIDKDGWLHTGDIAMWLPNGTIRIIDRIKHILKLSQGEYVAPEKLENIYLQSPYISQILVYGESLQNYLVAIVIPDEESVTSWCNKNSKNLNFLEACMDAEVKELILDEMYRIAKTADLMSFEKVKKIHLHPKLLTLEDGHLTPTLKTRRMICRNYFTQQIQNMYEECD